MRLTITIPNQLAAPLHSAYGEDLSQAILESFILSGYRAGKISRFQVQAILGFDNRWDTENWLGDRSVNQNYGLEDLAADRQTLDRIIKPAAGSSGDAVI